MKNLGVSILHQKDEKGHTAAHWACLGGHVQMIRYALLLLIITKCTCVNGCKCVLF